MSQPREDQLRSIGALQVCPIQSDRGYFDKVFENPKSQDIEAYVKAENPICQICRQSITKDCISHRIGFSLGLTFVHPIFLPEFCRFLNAICLVINDGGIMVGCGKAKFHPKGAGKTVNAHMTEASRLKLKEPYRCPFCNVTRPSMSEAGGKTVYVNKFVYNETSDSMLIKYQFAVSKAEIEVSFTDLRNFMDYEESPSVNLPNGLSRPKNIFEAAKFFGINIDMRTLITDTISILPPAMRPSTFGQAYETVHYLKLLESLSYARTAYSRQMTNQNMSPMANMPGMRTPTNPSISIRQQSASSTPVMSILPEALSTPTTEFVPRVPLAMDKSSRSKLGGIINSQAQARNRLFRARPEVEITPDISTLPSPVTAAGAAASGSDSVVASPLRANQNIAIPSISSACSGVIKELYSLLVTKSDNTQQMNAYWKINGKHGTIRRDLTAKQISNGGRAVISPADPFMNSFGEFGVSDHFRQLLTSELVNQYNMSLISDLAANGLIRYVQKFIDGKKIRYKQGMEISVGDKVYRNLMDGDPCIANRNPTLHEYSIVSQTLRFTGDAVMRLSSTATAPYGADFDGDCMNIAAPTEFSSRLELMSMSHIVNKIIGPNSPMYAPLFHELAALMCMSLEESCVIIKSPDLYVAAYHKMADFDERFASLRARRLQIRGEDYEGLRYNRDILSMLFPPDFNFNAKGVVIKKGIYVKGHFNKSAIGRSRGGVIHMMAPLYSNKRMAMFISDCQRISSVFMKTRGMAMNPDDMLGGQNSVAVRGNIGKTIAEIEEILNDPNPPLDAAEQISMIGKRPTKYLEGLELMSSKSKRGEELAKNTMYILTSSGARGNVRNLCEMQSSIGQRYIGSEFVDTSNCPMIHNPRLSKKTALENGFIQNSYSSGMTPEEFIVSSVPVRHSIANGKNDIREHGNVSNQLNSIFSTLVLEQDLTMRCGSLLLSHAPGSFLTPNSLIPIEVGGYHYDTFFDPRMAS